VLKTVKELWDSQKLFTERVISALDKPIEEMTEDDRVKWTKEYLLSLSTECSEALSTLPWKLHRKYDSKDRNYRYEFLTELIDIQKYLWGLMQIWGVAIEEFIEMFKTKTYEVEKRWVQEFELLGIENEKKVCVIDIDGVLNNYPQCFYDWVGGKFDLSLHELTATAHASFKEKYRLSGAKRLQKVNLESKEALKLLKKQGYTVVLLTKRPYQYVRRIVSDTLWWLDKNDIPYDYIFWSQGKPKAFILDKITDMRFAVDDSFDSCAEFHEAGVKTYWFTTNTERYFDHKVCSLLDLEEIKHG